MTRDDKLAAAIAAAENRFQGEQWLVKPAPPSRKPKKVFTRRGPSWKVAKAFKAGGGRYS